ncbi:MAG: hypothetical protein AAFR38_04905 [Planctomycetota bacterium]
MKAAGLIEGVPVQMLVGSTFSQRERDSFAREFDHEVGAACRELIDDLHAATADFGRYARDRTRAWGECGGEYKTVAVALVDLLCPAVSKKLLRKLSSRVFRAVFQRGTGRAASRLKTQIWARCRYGASEYSRVIDMITGTTETELEAEINHAALSPTDRLHGDDPALYDTLLAVSVGRMLFPEKSDAWWQDEFQREISEAGYPAVGVDYHADILDGYISEFEMYRQRNGLSTGASDIPTHGPRFTRHWARTIPRRGVQGPLEP